ncbi:transcriptional antiterminator, BglG family [Alkalithermobacter thermoalcaliphilus JW-YL-7 = DSM 7308]|uniref:Transcriptional antiterminator, BglG n=1 Tax=Alkalithermobacter thermoalcaliphilus JW-YL-7 = DSM 7308 TaxID=1121328 RepID=A0A150FT97_CLOPD|nr:transcriptional antiterminator, BglG [[Clostridium] paradoxum JW-YL-7 = DSM 7308]SHK34533.1 transcriptional antiterminator, BglG family [[Clostridium] paradoxum JW-YL-7 = DSM 7308]
MRIKKILNNNVVVVNDGQEKILMGLGIGFQKKVNDLVDKSKIEKIFVMKDDKENKKFQELMLNTPLEYINITEKIITYAENTLNCKLNDHIHIALTDHLAYAIERLKEGVQIKNKLLNEIKVLYKEEYSVGLWAKDLIKKEINVDISEDEVGYIALHIYTARLNYKNMKYTIDTTRIIQDIVDIIQSDLDIYINEESISYQRLVTHLKFTIQRLSENEQIHDMDENMMKVIKENYKESFACANKIVAYLESELGYEIPEGEIGYITLHIERIKTK